MRTARVHHAARRCGGGMAVSGGAQQEGKNRKVGVLHPGRAAALDARITAINEGLNDPSQRFRTELVVSLAYGELSRLPLLAADLVNDRVHAIVAVGPPAVQAAKDATADIPVIAIDLESDPVASGWIESLARPRSNVTGVFLDFPDFAAKCLQLLKEAVPSLSGIGVLWDPTTGSLQLAAVQAAARGMGIDIKVFEARRAADIADAFHALDLAHIQGALVLSSPLFGGNPQLVAGIAARKKVPTISLLPDIAREGGLLAYGPDIQGVYRQAGGMVRKVLHGTNPAEMPAERPTRFELIANLKTAKALGLEVPPYTTRPCRRSDRMMKRREFIAGLAGAAAAWPVTARAQQQDRGRRVAVLEGYAQSDPEGESRIRAFAEGLQELGWRDGRNVTIDYHFDAANPKILDANAAVLALQKPDVIVTTTTPITQTVLRYSKSTPVVFVNLSDPIGSGLVMSFAKPGSNVTGFTNYEASLAGKWLELIKEVDRSVTKVTVISNANNPTAAMFFGSIQTAGASIGVHATLFGIRDFIRYQFSDRLIPPPAQRWPDRAAGTCHRNSPRAHYCVGGAIPFARDLPLSLLRYRWGPHGLRCKAKGPVSARRLICRSYP